MSEAVAKKKTNWAEEAWQLFLLALAVLAVHTAVAKPFYIPSGSMLPTLLVGDRLIVSKYPYGYSYLSPSLNMLPRMPGRLFGSLPERGDIVVLKSPIAQDDWIKRVIGLPGDIVQMKDGQLWLNGQPVPKVQVEDPVLQVTPNSDCASMVDAQYRVITPDGTAECHLPTYRETLPSGRSYLVHDMAALPQDNTEAVIVPEGRVFLMGDNRDNSEDSRFPAEAGGLGLLPIENLVGRAEFTTFSLDGSTSFNPVTWITALRNRWFLSLRD
jgi:signal peptidase I